MAKHVIRSKGTLEEVITLKAHTRLINAVLILIAISSVLLSTLSVFRAFDSGWSLKYTLDLLLALALVILMLFRAKLNNQTKSHIVLIVAAIAIINDYLFYGLLSPLSIIYGLAIVYALSFYTEKSALIFSSTMLIAIAIITYLHITIWHDEYSQPMTYLGSIYSWLLLIGLLTFSLLFISFVIISMRRLTTRLLRHVNDRNALLSKKAVLLEQLAMTDSLTELYNRRAFLTVVKKQLPRTKHHHYILMIDICHFARINDTYSHYTGDMLLIAFAQRLIEVLPTQSTIARTGGNEFSVLIALPVSEDIQAFGKHLQEQIQQSYRIDHKTLSITTALGMSLFTPQLDYTLNLRRADLALFYAKSHKQECVIYDETIDNFYHTEQTLEKYMYEAFAQKSFYFNFQPLVNGRSGKIIGCESLMRLNHPELGNIRPDIFIPIVERMGLADKLNDYVVNEVLCYFCLLDLAPNQNFKLSLNISPVVYDFPTHMQSLIEQIKQHPIPKWLNIEFEITESQLMQHLESNSLNISQMFAQLKMHNIGLSMDDFGTQYSSLNRFINYSFNTIKIDKSFTQRLDQPHNQPVIGAVKAIVLLANELNISLIAEGAETKAQVDKLIELGCDCIQGYYFYRPMPIKKLIQNLTENWSQHNNQAQ
ncbi:putative bifunctional diguanylate cyclase/phosphodiesterase [Cysteiniphilum sp. 6C5]|uniref:putative bifunctional diguanylate cyclase/phosphodiesterase n=1 Tax=unclassified Cysteiniphilum TaxID=2610889 RepID=UPI003F82B200